MELKKSPLAPAQMAELSPIGGVRLASCETGVKYVGRRDLLLVELAEGTQLAGVYTKSKTRGANIEWCISANPEARAIVVNSGNANAFNGIAGMQAVQAVAQEVAQRVGCEVEQVYMASTGVIGEPLPHEKITVKLDDLQGALAGDGWQEAAEAICTTDTFPKLAAREIELSGGTIRIQGIAKGSGMIAPDMATMLGFVFTDAALEGEALQHMLKLATNSSFNSITVDSDTSTSDMVLLAATGESEVPLACALDEAKFYDALESLCIELAQLIVKDGEGAQKFVEIQLEGAESDEAAHRIALAVANSPLVKTAIAGEDANWGRIIMALGKTGEAVDRDSISLSIGGVEIVRDGQPVTGYDETPVAQHMQGQNILIQISLGLSEGEATVWTCDLTHGYIEINGDYRS